MQHSISYLGIKTCTQKTAKKSSTLLLAQSYWRFAHCNLRNFRTKKFDEIHFSKKADFFLVRAKNARATMLMKLTPDVVRSGGLAPSRNSFVSAQASKIFRSRCSLDLNFCHIFVNDGLQSNSPGFTSFYDLRSY